MFALPTVVTQAQAPGVLRQLVQHWPTQAPVHLDASVVEQFDSSTLAVLLACVRQAQACLSDCIPWPRSMAWPIFWGCAQAPEAFSDFASLLV